MKFQDEGPRLRERYRNSPGHEADDEETAGPSELPSDNVSVSSSSSSNQTRTQHAWDLQDPEAPEEQPGWLAGLHASIHGLDAGRAFFPLTEESGALIPMTVDSAQLLRFNNMLFSPNIAQTQLLHSFATSIAPGDQSGMPQIMRHHTRWLSHLPPKSGTDPLLDTAVRAVTLAHLGRLHNNESFLNESRPYYGKALRLLNAALLDPEKGLASETLSATMLLSFYEMFSSEEDDSWIRHAGGAGTLMRIRGPARHRYGFDREMYLAFRLALVIESFEKDRPCFLDTPEWRELAEQIHEDVRSSGTVGDQIEIFDLGNAFFKEMVQCPGLVCDARHFDKTIQLLGGKEAATEDIIRRTLAHRINMKNIFVRLSAALRNLGQAPTSYLSGDPIIPIYYKYHNVFTASLHTGYWSILILLNFALRELEDSPEKKDFYTLESREAALDCCRSEPFMEKSSFLGPFFVLFALRLSLSALEPAHEREWVLQRLEHIGNTHLSIAKHIPSYIRGPVPRIREAVKAANKMKEKST